MKQQIVSLFATSVVSILLLIVRVLYSGDISQNYLLVNLFLAWIPYALSLFMLRYISAKKSNTMIIILGGITWLLFFPNAPYIVTDFIHLSPISTIPLWYDSMLLCAFAFHGIVLGVASLQIMTKIVGRKFGQRVRDTFLPMVILVSSVGIYAGRMLRWNSWDVFFNPHGLITFLASQSLHPLDHIKAGIFILSFSLFFLVCYVFFSPILSVRSRKM